MIRRITNPDRWAAIPVKALEDSRISWKARGLLAFILAKPDDWTIRLQHLVASSDHDGKCSVQAGLKELVDAGYATLESTRSDDGTQTAGMQYHITDTSETYQIENLPDRKPTQQKTRSLTKDSLLLKEKEKKDISLPSAERESSELNIDLTTEPECNDPMFVCEHEREALIVVTQVLGFPAKRHVNLHRFCHEHSLKEIEQVTTSYCKEVTDVTKWYAGFIFAEGLVEARLASLQPQKHSVQKTQDGERPGIYRVFDTTPEPRPPEVDMQDIRALVADVQAKLNANTTREQATKNIEEL